MYGKTDVSDSKCFKKVSFILIGVYALFSLSFVIRFGGGGILPMMSCIIFLP